MLGAVRDAQRAHDGELVSVSQIAAVCAGPWRDRGDLVTEALWLLQAQGLVLAPSGETRAWKMTAADV